MTETWNLGVDVGSVSVSAVLVDGAGQPRTWFHRAHRGSPREILAEILKEIGPVVVRGTGLTAGSPSLLESARAVDAQVALIAGARHLVTGARSILFVGGERFGLIRLSADGAYLGTRANSSCAAGTGSFLDQQARRLGFADVSELSRRASACVSPPPRISTRCAVFARTDLAHAQQQGFSLEEISEGLCKGLAQNIADAILAGERPEGPILFAGGVSLNQSVRKHLEQAMGLPLVTHELGPVLAAFGAAREVMAQADPVGDPAPASLLPETRA
ncbi:MAG TPA: BadF/BadG/BcrA/BcrD ATPase family protein, partial [Spirochaetia bacterium]|nr:BadF/BadG/BcrA/BcrD ATPase family protein [Spirochaetia bacterium]